MLKNVKWGEWKLDDIFDGVNGDFDIQKKHINNRGDWIVTSGLVDDGVLGKSDILAKTFPKNTLTVDMFGNVFYRAFGYKMVTHARVFSLIPKIEISQNQLLFASNSLKYLSKMFAYGNMCTWAKIKNFKIRLPIKNRAIDFKFMEKFITKLQANKMQELKKYLETVGLANCKLTEKEEKILNQKVKLKEFEFCEIFDHIKQGRRLKKEDQIPGNIPFVMSGTHNNGVANYISNPIASFPSNSITIDIFGNAFYRNFEFGAGDDTGVYWNEAKKYSSLVMLYFASAMQKSLENKFSYGYKLRSSQSLNFKMFLPVKNNAPDYEYMESYIKALQKLIIADVQKYAEAKIKAAKKLTEEKDD